MTKLTRTLIPSILSAILAILSFIVWRNFEAKEENRRTGAESIENSVISESDPGGMLNELGNGESELPPDPLKLVSDFDVIFQKASGTSGSEWTSSLRELASMINQLEGTSKFKSLIASALMTGKTSDLVIARLMANEVSANDTLPGLADIVFSIPDDPQLIEFICDTYPEVRKEKLRSLSESAEEFASRLEPELIFPIENWSSAKTSTAIITEKHLTASLLVIGIAPLKQQAARITAIFLKRGGDASLTGTDLESELTRLVGKEIEELSIPFMSHEQPTSITISFLIESAKELFKKN